MNLETLYHQVNEAVASLDFEKVWPGFEPLKFALYDKDSCFFDGKVIDKTDQFCANTSINFQGEQIAIWMVAEELDIPVLYADTIRTNTRSQHVLEKVGFTFVREDGDFKYYEIRRDAPRPEPE